MPFINLHDGGRIAYDVFDFTDPWKNAETIVLVHGFSKNRKFYYAWIPALSRQYRTIVLDLRGHGESSLPPQDFKMSLDPFAEDLNEFLDRLEVEPAHFCMADFATSLGIIFAVRYPNRLRSLILPGFGYNWKHSSINFQDWIKILQAEGSERWARATNHTRLPADADPLLKEWYIQQQGRMPSWLLVKVFEYSPTVDLTGLLPKIQAPTLILAGGAAKQEPIETVKKGADLIPNCETVVFENAPFNVMNNRPRECVMATLDFLKRHPYR
jgi:3-oxoadipate enol-lactonase